MEIIKKHSSDVSREEMQELFAMLRAVYDDYNLEAFDSCIGGIHFFAKKEEKIIGHVAIVQRAITIIDEGYKVGYIESMGVLPEYQKQGIGMALMEKANEVIAHTYDFGALCPSDIGVKLYLKAGWEKINPPFFEYTATGIEESNEAVIMVYDYPLDVNFDWPLTCDFRRGDAW